MKDGSRESIRRSIRENRMIAVAITDARTNDQITAPTVNPCGSILIWAALVVLGRAHVGDRKWNASAVGFECICASLATSSRIAHDRMSNLGQRLS